VRRSLPSGRGIPLRQRLAQARAGSLDALGTLLMDCREHLLRLARRQLGPGLQGKVCAADLVQDTFLEAQRDFAGFSGTTLQDLLAWLSRILIHNAMNVARRYRGTEKRDVGREVALPDTGQESAEGEALRRVPPPWEVLAAREDAVALSRALTRLPEPYQRVLRLRCHDQLSFAEIGSALACSAEAARKLWGRAVDRLRTHLGGVRQGRTLD
jgi:RNA polymerase sigma-70 factor (ECF subfamily)